MFGSAIRLLKKLLSVATSFVLLLTVFSVVPFGNYASGATIYDSNKVSYTASYPLIIRIVCYIIIIRLYCPYKKTIAVIKIKIENTHMIIFFFIKSPTFTYIICLC